MHAAKGRNARGRARILSVEVGSTRAGQSARIACIHDKLVHTIYWILSIESILSIKREAPSIGSLIRFMQKGVEKSIYLG